MLNTTGQCVDTYKTRLERSDVIVEVWAVRSKCVAVLQTTMATQVGKLEQDVAGIGAVWR